MGKELDLIAGMIERTSERVDQMTAGLGEVAAHVATLIERTDHLATREDVSTAIQTHTTACRTSLLARRGNGGSSGGMPAPVARLLKAIAVLLSAVAAAVGAYWGLAP
jgi:hypothetical protein